MAESLSITVARADFLEAFRPLKKHVKKSDPGQAIIAMNEGALSFSAVGITVGLKVDGSLGPGERRVPAKFLLGLAKDPPPGDPINITVTGDRIRIGDVSIQCVITNTWRSNIELPLDPTLYQVLALRFQYTKKEIEQAGLTARLAKAEEVVEKRIEKAVEPLLVSVTKKESYMRKARTVFSSALLAAVLLIPCPGLEGAESAVVTILHVNDTHSHLDPLGPRTPDLAGTVGGAARAATVIARERAADPNALFLHAGDAIITDPTFNAFIGVPAYEVLGMLGTDAFTYGNHEFDFGPDVLGGTMLKQATAFAGVPLLGANLENLPAVPSIQARTKSWIVKEVNGVKVGIFGLTIPDMPDAHPSPLVISDETAAAASKALEEMRKAGAEVFVHLSHLGIRGDRELVKTVPGIDVVVGGHDHFLFTTPEVETAPDGKKVPILQVGAYFKYVGRLRFTVKDGAFSLLDFKAIPVDDSIPADPKVEAFVEALHPKIVAAYGDLFGTKLGTTGQALANTFEAGSARRDTSLGNLIADAYRNYTRTEIAFTSLALLSDGIPAGPIIGLDVFRAVGYGYDPATGLGYRLATCRISGDALLTALKLVLAVDEYANSLLPQTSGLTFAYNGKADPAERIIQRTVFVNGRPLDLSRSYTLTSSEYVLDLIKNLVTLEDVVVLPGSNEYTVLKQEIERQGTVRSLSWGRIVDVATGFDSVATE